jgi:hypothetical protein
MLTDEFGYLQRVEANVTLYKAHPDFTATLPLNGRVGSQENIVGIMKKMTLLILSIAALGMMACESGDSTNWDSAHAKAVLSANVFQDRMQIYEACMGGDRHAAQCEYSRPHRPEIHDWQVTLLETGVWEVTTGLETTDYKPAVWNVFESGVPPVLITAGYKKN